MEPDENPSSARASATTVSTPGSTGTHWTGPNDYLLAQAMRVNFVTAKRIRFEKNAENLAVQLQRFVHHEGSRPPNRKILFHLRLLTFYPPVVDIVPELLLLIESENVHVCRLAHYHLRQAAPHLSNGELHRDIYEALEREIVRPSPARRTAATKTLTKVLRHVDVARGTEFVANVFNTIGGARVEDPNKTVSRRVAGMNIPGTNVSKNRSNGILPSSKPVNATTVEEADKRDKRAIVEVDDGAGGVMSSFAEKVPVLKSKRGKVLVGHAVFAGLRRINRIAKDHARVDAYFFDSGFLSVNPSTVRHCIALLEIRSIVSPGPVSRYLVQRLPHKNPPQNKRLHLQDLGARVYFARLLGALAEDPDLTVFVHENAAPQVHYKTGPTLQEALGEPTLKQKATGLFKFLFHKDRATEIKGAVVNTKNAVVGQGRPPRLRRNDPLGVEFAEALVNLLKNASNRVLIEALRGLANRKWTTWFEAPVPQGALYNSPELDATSGVVGPDDSLDEEDDVDDIEKASDDPDELGAYDDDIGDEHEASNAPKRKSEAAQQEPDKDLGELAAEKQTWFSRLKSDRKQRRAERIDVETPFYLRKLGHGVVPALEVVLRRIYAAMLHDEPIRRFAAADATVALARAKIYGHVEEDHIQLRRAQNAYSGFAGSSTLSASREVAVGGQSGGTVALSGTAFDDEKHPLNSLVRPLTEIMAEDPNQYVRGRAAVALAFVLGAGAGRNKAASSASFQQQNTDDDDLDKNALMVRYFGAFVRNPDAGRGVGLRLVSDLVDYLVYEVLDAAPDLAPSAVQLVELWATRHPTIGVCGRLGAIWEKVLSMGLGAVVGTSIFRAVQSAPELERVASAAAAFLRRRTLDLAVLTVGASQLAGLAVPEPLPRAIGVEMEKYFSLLWHCALLGPSAECRVHAVEALAAAAVLAGDPFRVCVYERLVELVRVRGLGLKAAADAALGCLDMLYSARERFSEARAANNVPRDGSCVAKKWLTIVWQLAAEAASAAQILLGAPPPPGWQPLGPGGSADLANAERVLGSVSDRRKPKADASDSAPIVNAAPVDISLLRIEDSGDWQKQRVQTSKPLALGYTAHGFNDAICDEEAEESRPGRWRDNRYDEDDRYDSGSGPSRARYRERSRSYSRSRSRSRSRSDVEVAVHEDVESKRLRDEQIARDHELAMEMHNSETARRDTMPGSETLRAAAANAPVVAGRLLQGLQKGIRTGSKAASKAVKNMQDGNKR